MLCRLVDENGGGGGGVVVLVLWDQNGLIFSVRGVL